MASRVQKAIETAQLAVVADKNHEFDKAVRLYADAIALIEAEKGNFSLKYQESLSKYALAYQSRIGVLQQQIAARASHPQPKKSFREPVFEVAFTDTQPNLAAIGRIEAHPSDPSQHTFWLMRRLITTITDSGGGFLTHRLHIPNQVWTLPGARITAIANKVACCECVLTHIARLHEITFHDTPRFINGLNQFLSDASLHQNSLSKYLSFIDEDVIPPEPGKGMKFSDRLRQMGNSISKTASRLGTIPTRVANSDRYVQLLSNVFQESQAIGVWLMQCDAKGENLANVKERLQRVSLFLSNVVMAFVLNDLAVMLEQYLRKSRQSFTRIAP
eukprot:c5520_g1_i1.p1 GENE.c5520_g1_i1~~c5520_g1_i1.p1  ORF type:complete len:331 (-),score=75.71 c5520_g1_i1:909-1901(-)